MEPTPPQICYISDVEKFLTIQKAQELWRTLPGLLRMDPWFNEIFLCLEGRPGPPDPYEAARIQRESAYYQINRRVLCYKRDTPYWRICIPADLRAPVLHQVHDSSLGCHQGQSKTYKRLVSCYYWPTMHRDCKAYVARCLLCQQHKNPPRNYHQGLKGRSFSQTPWVTLHVDTWSPGAITKSRTRKGNVKVLAMVDSFSKWVCLAAIKNEKANTVVPILRNWFLTHGPPQQLVADSGPAFISDLQCEMLNEFGVSKNLIIPYNPQANGQVERFWRTMRAMLAPIVHEYPRDWDDHLAAVAFSYNTSYHRSIDNTPFFLMLGRNPQIACHEYLIDEGSSYSQILPYPVDEPDPEQAEENREIVTNLLDGESDTYRPNTLPFSKNNPRWGMKPNQTQSEAWTRAYEKLTQDREKNRENRGGGPSGSRLRKVSFKKDDKVWFRNFRLVNSQYLS